MQAPLYDPSLNDFFDVIKSFITLSADSKLAMAAILDRKELPKGYQLVSAGTVCRHVYLLRRALPGRFIVKTGKM